MITENIRKQLADYRKHGKKLIYLINYLMGLSDISILISMRHWQQSCSAMDIFTLFLIPQMHIYSHGLQLRSPTGSCNRHNKNLFGSAIRQLLLLSKYPQIYLKRYPRHTRKNVFQSGIFYTTSE